VNVLDDLDAFLREHGRCGFLDSEVQRGDQRVRVTLACDCGAVISRIVERALPLRA
jgi:hypothetical protein